jgi:hypothetical protein
MKQKLNCLSEDVAIELYQNVELNKDRYLTSGFEDLAANYGWNVELQVTVDLDPLKELNSDKGADNEVNNAMLVWRGLKELTPSLACENRIWTRLTHVECFSFSRDRWIKSASGENVAKVIRDHFFANNRTKWRDDNAISRLWWIAYIASTIPSFEQKKVLEFILKKADIRSNFIERPLISSRPKLAASIIRCMMVDEWITEKEGNYRSFMKQVNKYGGGLLFESWLETELDGFVRHCAAIAKSETPLFT